MLEDKRRGHPRFYELSKEREALHDRKNALYAGDDPLSNLKGCEVFGVPAYIGCLVRLQDKNDRIKNVALVDEMVASPLHGETEGLGDNLFDQSIYSDLDLILLEEFQRLAEEDRRTILANLRQNAEILARATSTAAARGSIGTSTGGIKGEMA